MSLSEAGEVAGEGAGGVGSAQSSRASRPLALVPRNPGPRPPPALPGPGPRPGAPALEPAGALADPRNEDRTAGLQDGHRLLVGARYRGDQVVAAAVEVEALPVGALALGVVAEDERDVRALGDLGRPCGIGPVVEDDRVVVLGGSRLDRVGGRRRRAADRRRAAARADVPGAVLADGADDRDLLALGGQREQAAGVLEQDAALLGHVLRERLVRGRRDIGGGLGDRMVEQAEAEL